MGIEIQKSTSIHHYAVYAVLHKQFVTSIVPSMSIRCRKFDLLGNYELPTAHLFRRGSSRKKIWGPGPPVMASAGARA